MRPSFRGFVLRQFHAHALKCALVLWAAAVLGGTGWLLHYSNTAGETASHREGWPAASRIERGGERPSMLVFAHPHCPCSSASIGELERLMPSLRNRADVVVVFIQPRDRSPAWVESGLWERAKAIPGVKVLSDENASEADLFGAKTSGQTFLFDREGTLVFSGGLTPSRGHMGDSEGRRFILAWMNGDQSGTLVSRVFGCALKEGELGGGRE